MNPTEILRQPYGRIVVPDSDGTYRAEIVEFPGCIATGDTAAEALANLEDTAWDWLEAVIERGQRIPEPVEAAGYSGKLVVRLPKSLHRKAAYQAARDGGSLNQFIVTSIAEQVGAKAATYSTHAMAVGHTGALYMTIAYDAEAVTTQTRQALIETGLQSWLKIPFTLQKTESDHARS